jgi:radical SAM protein with 4Fe4S-binding SPASM domain
MNCGRWSFLVIRFKLREEKQGAYLLDRHRGISIELSQPEFEFLNALHEGGDHLPGWPQDGIDRYFRNNARAGQAWWQTLQELELTHRPGIEELQVIRIPDDDRAHMPDDCLAAPTRIYFELTRRCNLACRSCFNNSHYPLEEELSTQEIINSLEQLNRLGTFEIRFTGGEATEHPDFRRIVDYARQCGFYLSLGTNGVYSDKKRSWIYDAGIDWFIVSLDGNEVVNDRVRGLGTYRQVVKTLRDLSLRPHLRVRLNAVIARHNVDCLAELAHLADEYGVESLNLIPLRPYGRSVWTMLPDMFDQHDFYAFIQQIQALRSCHRVKFITTLDLLDPEATTSHDPIVQKKNTCAAGVEAAVIGANGDVFGCSYSPASFPNSSDTEGRRLFVAGNLREDSLRTIWLDSSRWAVFRQLDNYKSSKCQMCAHYGVRCVGSCPIMGYFNQGQPDAFDAYCFVDLIP